MKKTVKQKYYLDIEIDESEKDIIFLCQKGRSDSNLILIEIEKLSELIDQLKSILND